MFVKIVIVLLLLIVLASLLAPRADAVGGKRQPSLLRPSMLRAAIALLTIAALVVLLHLAGCSDGARPFHAQDVTGADFARLAALDGLSGHDGERFAAARLAGKAVVVFFGYTHCPDVCPATLAMLKATMERLGRHAERVAVLFVTLDPERDTTTRLKEYVGWFDPRFQWLRGDWDATRLLAREFRILYSHTGDANGNGDFLDHSANGFVYDPQGRLRLLVRQGQTPENLAADLSRLLAGE